MKYKIKQYSLTTLILIILVTNNIYGQHFLKIKVVDTLSIDHIANVNIFLNDSLIGNSDNYGYFKVEVPNKKYIIKLSHISYEDKNIVWYYSKDGLLIIPLKFRTQDFIGYKLKRNKNFNKKFGEVRIPIDYLKKIPYILGELDVLKAIQTFPGVSSSYEANSSLYVRGGNIDQSSIILDDAPVYNIGHFYGFFSPFDGDAIKSVTIMNSGINSGYGSRGSSIIDVRFKEGNMRKHEGILNFGVLTTKAMIEGPIIYNKLSYLGSIRFAYPTTLINSNSSNNFVDGNFKLKYSPDSFNTFFLSTFISRDQFSFGNINEFTIGNSQINKYSWGNRTGTFRLNHITRNGVSVNSLASYSKFSSRAYFSEETEPDFGNELKNYLLKIEFANLNGVPRTNRYGISTNYYLSSPAILHFHRKDTAIFQQNLIPINHALEFCVYGDNIFKIIKRKITLHFNLRLGLYKNLDDNYIDPIIEPRFKLIKEFKEYSLYASFDKNSQYQNYVGNKQIAVPSDFWIQASNDFNSQKIFAYSLGFYKTKKIFNFSSEIFFKDYQNALDIKDGGNLFRNINVLDDILTVKSIAYGGEILLEKHIGKFQGHLSYTLSRSIRKNILINNGNWFASNFDRTHMFNLALNFKPNKKWSWGFLAIIQSGTPVTANYAYSYLYSLRNEYRLPLYYRLDFTVTKSFKIRKKISSEWNISVFNATFSKNRTSQYPAFNSFGSLPLIPSISLKIYFCKN